MDEGVKNEAPNGLKRFMTELAGSVDRLGDFIADPKAAAEAAGLTDEEKEALFSGDQGRIYIAIGGISMTQTDAEKNAAAAQQQQQPAHYPQQPQYPQQQQQQYPPTYYLCYVAGGRYV